MKPAATTRVLMALREATAEIFCCRAFRENLNWYRASIELEGERAFRPFTDYPAALWDHARGPIKGVLCAATGHDWLVEDLGGPENGPIFSGCCLRCGRSF